MQLTREWIPLTGDENKALPTYQVQPRNVDTALPTVVVIQEAFGVDEHIQDIADRFATAGYRALAPDLWSLGGQRAPAMTLARMEALKRFLEIMPPGAWGKPELRDQAMAKLPGNEGKEMKETMDAFMSVPRDTLPKHVAPVIRWARRNGQAVGTVGFCLGGGVSAALATMDGAPDAAVDYYGMAPSPDKAGELRCPVLAMVADLEKDPAITGAALAMAEKAKSRFAVRVYKGASHAFNNDTRSSYHPGAARDSWARTLSFFAERLAHV